MMQIHNKRLLTLIYRINDSTSTLHHNTKTSLSLANKQLSTNVKTIKTSTIFQIMSIWYYLCSKMPSRNFSSSCSSLFSLVIISLRLQWNKFNTNWAVFLLSIETSSWTENNHNFNIYRTPYQQGRLWI